MSSTLTPAATPLARQARERFVAHMEAVLPELSEAVRTALAESMHMAQSSRDMHARRDALVDFEKEAARWAEGTVRAWRRAIVPPTATGRVRLQMKSLELIGDDVVENKILSSRLAMAVQEKAVWDLSDLRLRITHLEGGEDLGIEDVLRPEALAQLMVEQWMACKLSRDTWAAAKDVIAQYVTPRAVQGYRDANEFLIGRGVLPEIDLSARVKRPPSSTTRPAALSGPGGPDSRGHGGEGGFAPSGFAGAPSGGHAGGRGNGGAGGGGYPGASGGPSGGGYAGGAGGGHSGASGGGDAGGPGGGYASGSGGGYAGAPGGPHAAGYAATGGHSGGGHAGHGGPAGRGRAGAAGASTGRGGVSDETRMMTNTTPLARARARATGVIGQLRRLLTERVPGFDGAQGAGQGSPGLADAVTHHAHQMQTQVQTRVSEAAMTAGDIVIFDDADVEQVAGDLRQRTQALKKKASTSAEKATIEIVALMFQSILSEERIPAGVRVWFARLQMPVLRVALSEPEFFGSLEHPARQLIDRMGSCVLGFDTTSINGTALENEIKRVVQVIEQYPETGRRVFQLVYEEFERFLSRYLTEKGPTQKLVSVAQQVEQKETMAIQYTIELRKMLSDVPVREEIREFLFKVWAEVMAVAAVKNGPQHADTLALKKSASDLVWAASAKPNRNDRAKVIQDLPDLLARLRRGMTLLGVQASDQESHIKVIGDTLADAFLSKTEAIPHARIEEMTRRLANLEDFVTDEDMGELALDKESIEMMLGIDASMIEVIGAGGSNPGGAVLAWANELQTGHWFMLDHNNRVTQVQYAWRSDRGQLHLFASADGHCHLMQLQHLAAYLQAGLLVPNEEETLTVRATRDALAKLDANPDRLLQ